MSSDKSITLSVENGIATLTLSRAEKHNAFDDQLIADMIALIDEVAADERARVVVLAAEGRSFSAGADLNWMRRCAEYSEAQNTEDSLRLGTLMHKLNHLPKPTVAKVQGAAFGGGVGLVACCDIAIASERAKFSLSEVNLGLIPAVISPFVISAIGVRQARRLFLTGERIDAQTALQMDLVHEVVDEASLDSTVDKAIQQLLSSGPAAMAEAKELIWAVSHRPIDQAVLQDTASRIARVRVSPEGQEGLSAFLEKRQPNWTE